MKRVAVNAGFAVIAVSAITACSALRPAPQIITRTDTVTVTREVVPPLPSGDTATICLANGVPVTVMVSGADTLIGDARVKLKDVHPTLVFAGAYARDASWFSADTIRFEKRLYRKTTVPMRRDCDELKQVGDYRGVAVFAAYDAPNNLPLLFLPVRPSYFQPYAPVTPTRRR